MLSFKSLQLGLILIGFPTLQEKEKLLNFIYIQTKKFSALIFELWSNRRHFTEPARCWSEIQPPEIHPPDRRRQSSPQHLSASVTRFPHKPLIAWHHKPVPCTLGRTRPSRARASYSNPQTWPMTPSSDPVCLGSSRHLYAFSWWDPSHNLHKLLLLSLLLRIFQETFLYKLAVRKRVSQWVFFLYIMWN